MDALFFHLFCRNIGDVLSCFSDSPPPSPTFPEGGNPVLYGEDDVKVPGLEHAQILSGTAGTAKAYEMTV